LRSNGKDQVAFWNGAEEQVLFDFGAAVRDSWGIDLVFDDFTIHYTITLISKMTKVMTPAGEFESCYRFDFVSTDVLDGNWTVVICPRVGVVLRIGGMGFTIPLESYFTSGKRGCPP